MPAMNIWGSSGPYCDRVSRRNLLKVGTFGLGGLSITDFSRLQASGAIRGEAPCKAVILVFLGGGPSHFETFDPKPDAPSEIRGPYGKIGTSVPGIDVCETIPNLAKIAHRYSIIRSCCHTNPGHGGGQRWVNSGHSPAGLEDEAPHDFPMIGAVVSRMKGAQRAGLPAYVRCPGGGSRSDASYLGAAFSALNVYSTGLPIGLELESHIKLDRLDDRRSLRRSLDKLSARFDAAGSMDALEQQAADLLGGKALKDALNLSLEPRQSRERYGDHEAGRSFLLARRMVEAGVRFVSARIGNWDQHGNAGGTIHDTAKVQLPPIDQALPALLNDLYDRGLDKDVMVLMWGEFGRTPRINSFLGRDHWPQAMSVMMAGGGLKMGQVVGSTNAKGESPQDRALQPADVLATMYRQLGIDIEHSFINNAGRPIPILPYGEAIKELV